MVVDILSFMRHQPSYIIHICIALLPYIYDPIIVSTYIRVLYYLIPREYKRILYICDIRKENIRRY